MFNTSRIKRDIIKNGIGYAKKRGEYADWKEAGHHCAWEYCIEHQPLSVPRVSCSCELFGHDCPGGMKQVVECFPDGTTVQSKHLMDEMDAELDAQISIHKEEFDTLQTKYREKLKVDGLSSLGRL